MNVTPTGRSTDDALAQGQRKKRILIVDDNPDAAEMLGEFLAAVGHTTRVAHDGPTALALAAELLPEIALVDIGLPLMDGYELASRLRQMPELAGLRLIAVTGYGQPAMPLDGRIGFDEHWLKPIDILRLPELL
jgi:CheY-like chemotaxis protein